MAVVFLSTSQLVHVWGEHFVPELVRGVERLAEVKGHGAVISLVVSKAATCFCRPGRQGWGV